VPFRVGATVGGHTPAVPRQLIVPERSRVDVNARPGLPGLRLAVVEVGGHIEGDGGPGGGDRTGRLHLRLAVVPDGEPGGVAVPPWLDGDGPADVAAELRRVHTAGDGRVEVDAAVTFGDRTVTVAGSGRCTPGPHGPEVVGTSIVDPRALGFGLLPLVTFTLQVRWRLVLTADPAA
jgi:hypothetical protein